MVTQNIHTYWISGVCVQFPYPAYGTQQLLMSRLLTALKQGQSALLESPTGTGKTCALLCATLAWQQTLKPSLAHSPPPLPLDSPAHPDHPAPDPPAYPQIIYCTRTHSQISQVVAELARCPYRPTVAVLGSRERLCVNPRVSRLAAASKVAACRRLLRSDRGCAHHDNLEALLHHRRLHPDAVWDIEDMLQLGEAVGACPYFATREFSQHADLVVCPYNYLLSPAIRRSLALQLDAAVVILDEAHNIEDVARDAASCEISVPLLIHAQDQLDQLHARCLQLDAASSAFSNASHANSISIAYSPPSSPISSSPSFELHSPISEFNPILSTSTSTSSTSTSSTSITSTSISTSTSSLSAGSLAPLYSSASSFLRSILSWLHSSALPLLRPSDFNARSCSWDAPQLLPLLASWGASPDTHADLRRSLSKLLAHAASLPPSPDDPPGALLELHPAVAQLLEALCALLGFLFDHHAAPHYRLLLREDLDTRSGETDLRLSFLCMLPAVAFRALSACRSVVVTSGTLSPMRSFASELGFPFPTLHAGSHVVDLASQLWVRVFPKGPDGATPLSTSYARSAQLQLQDQLGEAILQIVARIPAGVLCFLPSYALLERLAARWQHTGLWARLCAAKKVFVEPSGGDTGEFSGVMEGYYAAVAKESEGGGLFFAVFRGKVAEGLDFADDNARGVIVAGIPYPNVRDEAVLLKRGYNDGRVAEGLLAGGEWYAQAAFRALNQAIGRCIRHKGDYGAVVLLDERFERKEVQAQISGWMRPAIATVASFQEGVASLSGFFGSQQGGEAKQQALAQRARKTRHPAPLKAFDMDAPIDRTLSSYFKKHRQN